MTEGIKGSAKRNALPCIKRGNASRQSIVQYVRYENRTGSDVPLMARKRDEWL